MCVCVCLYMHTEYTRDFCSSDVASLWHIRRQSRFSEYCHKTCPTAGTRAVASINDQLLPHFQQLFSHTWPKTRFPHYLEHTGAVINKSHVFSLY